MRLRWCASIVKLTICDYLITARHVQRLIDHQLTIMHTSSHRLYLLRTLIYRIYFYFHLLCTFYLFLLHCRAREDEDFPSKLFARILSLVYGFPSAGTDHGLPPLG